MTKIVYSLWQLSTVKSRHTIVFVTTQLSPKYKQYKRALIIKFILDNKIYIMDNSDSCISQGKHKVILRTSIADKLVCYKIFTNTVFNSGILI